MVKLFSQNVTHKLTANGSTEVPRLWLLIPNVTSYTTRRACWENHESAVQIHLYFIPPQDVIAVVN